MLFRSSDIQMGGGTDNYVRASVADGSNGTPRIGTKVEPINRQIKTWERTA